MTAGTLGRANLFMAALNLSAYLAPPPSVFLDSAKLQQCQ